MHESIRYPCLLGCIDGAKDSLKHYVHCPILFYLLIKLHPDSPPSPEPLNRIGLVDPSLNSMNSMACTFAAYHAVKRAACLAAVQEEPLELATTQRFHRIFV